MKASVALAAVGATGSPLATVLQEDAVVVEEEEEDKETLLGFKIITPSSSSP